MEKVKDLAIDGLFTDGAHHKQWYLEQILETLGINKIKNGIREYAACRFAPGSRLK